ncbi:T9SS type A sorting domain-containing protein [Neolewinella aurantiaca]|uniref:T9SS type A sorting domain-containing protein n=1 Tax=Neolewinella aurantiaca TaxID=2602767 RepID=A0A5C7FZN0_9BACT|nr:T9SS type A sorting domain-containing protein [Neolewinella aurantiaca]TXF90768.1 T9SS type A sorting domain-containing protein [Neolewinella aurantiaca]
MAPAAAPFSLFPNPVGNVLSLRNFPEDATFRLVDTNGRILRQGALKPQLEISDLPAGAYQFTATGHNWQVNQRVIKE